MKTLAAGLTLAFVVIASPALAAQREGGPQLLTGNPSVSLEVGPQRLAVNPSVSLSAPATSPVQAQIQDDYATQLTAEQSQLLQQNPSGTTRLEINIGHALNGFSPR
jgi:hypothetical protein